LKYYSVSDKPIKLSTNPETIKTLLPCKTAFDNKRIRAESLELQIARIHQTRELTLKQLGRLRLPDLCANTTFGHYSRVSNGVTGDFVRDTRGSLFHPRPEVYLLTCRLYNVTNMNCSSFTHPYAKKKKITLFIRQESTADWRVWKSDYFPKGWAIFVRTLHSLIFSVKIILGKQNEIFKYIS